MKEQTIYSKGQIENIVLGSSETSISDVAVHKRINKMIASGTLSRVGIGQYAFVHKRKFDYVFDDGASLSVLNKLNERFDKGVRFIVYESTLLNMFLNHLIGRPTILVEAEKDVAEAAFWFLKDEGFDHVMFRPSEDENFRYNPYDGSGVIVKTMVSKSPIDNKRHMMTAEKLAVDLVCDKTLRMFFEGAEVPALLEDILKNYAVKLDSIRNYAKRRHCLERFIECVPEEWKGEF